MEERVTNYFWFPLVDDFEKKNGYLLNILPTKVKPPNSDVEFAAVNLFFIEADGSSWRVQVIYKPYFYVMDPFENLPKYTENKKVFRIDEITKIDVGKGDRVAHKFSFVNVDDLTSVRNEIRKEPRCEMREFDVPYYVRCCIDLDIHVGYWYNVINNDGVVEVHHDETKEAPPQPRILAFDIECSKEALMFPNAEKNEIMMISYMVDGMGYLVTNRSWFSHDIESFEYSPIEYQCEFTVWNCDNEREMLKKWFEHILAIKPHVFVTFNGDGFDWPYIETRAKINHLSMYDIIGFYTREELGEKVCISQYIPHLDCFKWVQRDSYLPAGSQGLKAVTKAKLQYNPLELDPEDICPLGTENPQRLANYSVSDAYATYYLYMKYVHPFIFSLTTVLPLNPDDSLRKGTGTLCENLLMARAYNANIFFPNKETRNTELKYFNGHVIDNETYIGGNVEALNSGIFRDDIPLKFELDPNQYQVIIDRVPGILDFVLKTELFIEKDDLTNFDEVYNEIIHDLEDLRDNPVRNDTPIIIHLDVGAMYPNIILTNRLQPTAIVNDSICATCKMRSDDDSCQRKMKWTWRGEYYPATEPQTRSIIQQLQHESFKGKSWHSLTDEEQMNTVKKRLSEFCRKTYQKAKIKQPDDRWAIVCMKSNQFYIDTVRSFRDRRYEYKNKLKVWNNKRATARTPAEREEVKKMCVLYESLQLAHKAILNSFYGYVMRGGSRWKSMEMAGVVTLTGATIIRQTRAIVQGLGKGLELDTDGIWTALPPTFPMLKTFITKSGQKKVFSFPCSMLNQNVDLNFSNHAYHEYDPVTDTFTVRKENSIYFEVDGPYHAMFLPAAKEEGKKLKKRYAVFNSNGHITELKGFEIKRRGEWKMIKMMQSEAFGTYMKGNTNEEVYNNVADVCRQYLMVLKTRGKSIEDEELLELLSESSTMSKSLEEYGGRKSTSATTARRLAEVLGESILQSTGLKCEYIISKLPVGESVAGRAIPVIIFKSASQDSIISYLQKWCNDPTLQSPDFREIVDWDYYLNRLHNQLQKILVIPAYIQGVKLKNFDVPPPDWIIKKQRNELQMKAQTKINFTISKERPQKVVVEKYHRDIDQLTKYQKKLLGFKKTWRASRSKAAIERPLISSRFHEWRVIELRNSSTPGVVSAFVQTGLRSISRIDITVPRIIIINSTSTAAAQFQNFLGNFVKPVKINLPHSFPADVVSQITLPESVFVQQKSILTSAFGASGIHGVYETHVTPLFRSLINIGSSIQKPRKVSPSLNDIKRSKTVLLPEFSSFNKIFIYSVYRKHKGLIAYVPIQAGSKTAEAHVFLIYSKRNNSGELGKPSITTFQENAIAELKENTDDIVKITKYELTHCDKVSEAAEAMQNQLKTYGRYDTTVILLNSHLKFDQLMRTLKVSLLHSYPVISLDFQEADDMFEEGQFWHKNAIHFFVVRFIQHQLHLKMKLECSALLDEPIGNLAGDICMDSLDIQFARELKLANIALWYSESSEPDVGGSYSNALVTMPGDPFAAISANRKGTYLSKCVVYGISHLSTSAILECESFFPQLDQPNLKDFTSNPSLDAFNITKNVFIVLSSFLQKMVSRCENQSNILSSMIAHIGTWVISSQSVFYDPALHSVFYYILKYIFDQLVSHFEGSDIPVIYADQSQIVLNVGSMRVEHAFLELKKKQLLRWVDFQVIKSFDKLVWIDDYNYQGIEGEDYFPVWNVRGFLSKRYYEALEDFFNNLLMADEDSLVGLCSQLSKDMYQIAEDSRTLPAFTQNNPLLSPHINAKSEFVIMVSTLFYPLESLGDAPLQHEIQNLRRNILTIIQEGEFNQSAQYVNPSLSLIVPSVLCRHCFRVRNIDILRDEDILKGNWVCTYCQQPYDTTKLFERWMYEEFMRRYENYQNQDLKCTKCNVVQGRKMDANCEKDGSLFSNTIHPDDLILFMKTVQIAAKHHDFTFLNDAITAYLAITVPEVEPIKT